MHIQYRWVIVVRLMYSLATCWRYRRADHLLALSSQPTNESEPWTTLEPLLKLICFFTIPKFTIHMYCFKKQQSTYETLLYSSIQDTALFAYIIVIKMKFHASRLERTNAPTAIEWKCLKNRIVNVYVYNIIHM